MQPGEREKDGKKKKKKEKEKEERERAWKSSYVSETSDSHPKMKGRRRGEERGKEEDAEEEASFQWPLADLSNRDTWGGEGMQGG